MQGDRWKPVALVGYYQALTSPAQKYDDPLAHVYPMQRRAPLPAPSSQGIEEE